MGSAEGNLRPEGKVGESGVVNSVVQPGLAAAPMSAGIEGEAEPAIEVIGNAGTRTPGIGFQGAAYWQDSSGKQAMQISVGIEEGISAVKFPFGSRPVLCGCERGKATEDSNYRRAYSDPAIKIMRVR